MEWFILLHMPLISQNHIKKKTASLKAYRGSAGSFYILTFYVKEKGASFNLLGNNSISYLLLFSRKQIHIPYYSVKLTCR